AIPGIRPRCDPAISHASRFLHILQQVYAPRSEAGTYPPQNVTTAVSSRPLAIALRAAAPSPRLGRPLSRALSVLRAARAPSRDADSGTLPWRGVGRLFIGRGH